MAYVHGGLQRCECTSPRKSEVLMMDLLIITIINTTPSISFTRVLWLMKKYICPSSVFKAGNHWWHLYDVRKEYYMTLHSGLLDKCLFLCSTCQTVSVCFNTIKGILFGDTAVIKQICIDQSIRDRDAVSVKSWSFFFSWKNSPM